MKLDMGRPDAGFQFDPFETYKDKVKQEVSCGLFVVYCW